MLVSQCDIVVIGGGIAGASIAAHLSEHRRVQLLEMEDRPGHHSTGRSAALFSETYGNDAIRRLTRASRTFFASPPAGFCATALLKPRPVLITARPDQCHALEAFRSSTGPADEIEPASVAEALALCPILRPDNMAGLLVCRSTADIEVHELQEGYLRLLKARGGTTTTGARVVGLDRRSNGWVVRTETEILQADIVVNAAGAWAGEIGRIAGAIDIGLEPLRRTAILVAPPDGVDVRSWALLLDVDEKFYLKPDAGLLLVSPADETPTAPCDAQPEELDIAIAVERVQQATTLDIKHIRRKWAGLRSFVRDRTPVVGYDPNQAGLFWMAALGGYGIQTAPALSSLASSLVLDRPVAEPVAAFEIDLAGLSPQQFEGEFSSDETLETYFGGQRGR